MKSKTLKRRTSCAVMILVIALCMIASLTPAAQKTASGNKESFNAFWTKFKVALAKNDRPAILTMTKAALVGGETGYASDEAFLDQWYPELRQARRCLAKAKPKTENQRDTYVVYCADMMLVFQRADAAWKFADVQAAP